MKFLNTPRDAALLVFLRIAFGILAISEMLAQITYKRWYKGYYDPDEYGFPYIGFEWIQPFPEPFMSIFLLVTLAGAVGILLGYRYRWSATIFCLGYCYTYLMEKGLYLNHGYLFCWLSMVMIFLPATRGWSFDLRAGRTQDKSTIPFWAIALPASLMAIVYFFGGIAKMNSDWLQGIPLSRWIAYKKDMWLLGGLWANPSVGVFMAWSGMLLDSLVTFMLLWRRTRWLAMGLLIFFHLTNALLFVIGIFPWMSICLSTLFFPADWPRKFWQWLRAKWPKGCAWVERWGRPEDPNQLSTEHYQLNAFKFGLLAVLLSIHFFLPLRHHLFPGDVAWTEEGHRYAWRMMLRHKTGKGKFIVVGKENRDENVRPRQMMNNKFARKMYTHPDMIWQFAQYLKEDYESKGWEEVAVYADIKVRLNFRKYQTYIDPEVDLAQEEWTFFKSKKWILPEGIESRENKSD